MTSLSARAVTGLRPASAAQAKGESQANGAQSASSELQRLMDTLRQKERLIEEQTREISTLRTQAQVVQKQLLLKTAQADGAQEKAIRAQGGADASNKELTLIKADKKKLETQVSDLMRANAKLKADLARAGEKNPGLSHQLASLQSDVRSARMGQEATAEELRGVTNQLRAKDKELARMTKVVEEAQAVVIRNGELENRVRELTKCMESAQQEVRTMEGVVRTRDASVAQAVRDMEAAKDALAASNEAHADTTARLKAMTSRCNDLEADNNRLRDENARVGAVAARVAASEVTSGNKDEGTVSVVQHLEEIKYWSGEVNRLKDKIASLEKQLNVSDELKDRYRTQAERLSMGGTSSGGGAVGRRNSFSGLRNSLGGGSVGGSGDVSTPGRHARTSSGSAPLVPRPSTPASRSVGGGTPSVPVVSTGVRVGTPSKSLLDIPPGSGAVAEAIESVTAAVASLEMEAGDDDEVAVEEEVEVPQGRMTRGRAGGGGRNKAAARTVAMAEAGAGMAPVGPRTRRAAAAAAAAENDTVNVVDVTSK